MTNIINHGVGMNKINLAADFQELTCEEAAAIHGGAKIILYTGKNFQGGPLIFTSSNSGDRFRLDRTPYDNKISSAKVISGVWDLRSERDGTGLGVTLRPRRGQYPRFPRNFNNIASLAIAKVT